MCQQDQFETTPVVLVTAEHLATGNEYDSSLVWIEDTTRTSFKVCLREMQNFDGKHEDIYVVCTFRVFPLRKSPFTFFYLTAYAHLSPISDTDVTEVLVINDSIMHLS